MSDKPRQRRTHAAWNGVPDADGEVFDLEATRLLKEQTGKTIPVHMHKHESPHGDGLQWHSVIRDDNK